MYKTGKYIENYRNISNLWWIKNNLQILSGCSVKPCPETSHKLVELRSSNRCRSLGNTSGLWMSVFCWPILQLCRHHADWKIKDFMQRALAGALGHSLSRTKESVVGQLICGVNKALASKHASVATNSHRALRVLQIAINKSWTICFSSTTTQVSQQECFQLSMSPDQVHTFYAHFISLQAHHAKVKHVKQYDL